MNLLSLFLITKKKKCVCNLGPHAKYTHWKQTVFYINDSIIVKEGETVTGSLTCSPNKKNNRDLDIEISYELSSDAGNFSEVHKYKMC